MSDSDDQHTYRDIANAELSAGGRWGVAQAKRDTHWVGNGPPPPDARPHPNSPWAPSPVPVEPPLGIDVNAMNPVGTPLEIAKSIQALASAATPVAEEAPATSLPASPLHSPEQSTGAGASFTRRDGGKSR